MKVKLYRHTIMRILLSNEESNTVMYYQTGWNSFKEYTCDDNSTIINTEEKEVEVDHEG